MKNLNATKLQVLALALSTLGASQAFAGKPSGGGGSAVGVVTIDQDKAANGGVTIGDNPGFPVTISEPGSYRLESNLVVPDTNTTAIEITADGVTIDFNGFAIAGPNVCSSAAVCNFNNGTGHGITSTAKNVAVFGGTISGLGGLGVRVGRNGHIERMRFNNNGSTAIAVGQDSLVSDCTADLNGGYGVWADNGTLLVRNVFAYNLNGAYVNEVNQGKVSMGLNVFRYNLYQPWVGNPIHLQPSACFGSNCQ